MTRMVKEIDSGNFGDKFPTDRERIVCHHFLKSFNQQEAYALGYPNASEKSVATNASRFFAKPHIRNYLKRHVDARVEDTGKGFAAIINQLMQIITFNPFSIMKINDGGQPEVDLMRLHNDPSILSAVDVEYRTVSNGRGGTVPTYVIKPYNKLKATQQLLDYLKCCQPERDIQRPVIIRTHKQQHTQDEGV